MTEAQCDDVSCFCYPVRSEMPSNAILEEPISHLILNNINCGSILLRADERICFWNAWMEKMSGFSRVEVCGVQFTHLFPCLKDERLRHSIQDALKRGMSSVLSQSIHKSPLPLYRHHIDKNNDKRIYQQIHIMPIYDSNKISYCLITVADVTAAVIREQSLRAANRMLHTLTKKLQQVNADLEEFTYVVSHDLKAPLRGIMHLVNWIVGDLGDNIHDQIKYNLERIELRVHRLQQIIDDLLTFARVRNVDLELETVDFSIMVDGIVNDISMPDKFVIKVNDHASPIITVRTPLETILRNLIYNALQHHDLSEGIIIVSARKTTKHFIISVTDDGPGIPLEGQDHVLKLFKTLTKPGRGIGGTGIGLAVVKRLVECFDGELTIHSPVTERGTCFEFTWPIDISKHAGLNN